MFYFSYNRGQNALTMFSFSFNRGQNTLFLPQKGTKYPLSHITGDKIPLSLITGDKNTLKTTWTILQMCAKFSLFVCFCRFENLNRIGMSTMRKCVRSLEPVCMIIWNFTRLGAPFVLIIFLRNTDTISQGDLPCNVVGREGSPQYKMWVMWGGGVLSKMGVKVL
jgi:hypothetical protein